MLWNRSTIDACFLASSWQITNNGMMAATCIGVAFMVVLPEALRRVGKEYDNRILQHFQHRAAFLSAAAGAANNSVIEKSSCLPTAANHQSTLVFRASAL
jgi:copper transporter 1